MSIKGEMLKETSTNDSQASFDITDLAKGVYIIKIDDGKKIFNSKFVKQ